LEKSGDTFILKVSENKSSKKAIDKVCSVYDEANNMSVPELVKFINKQLSEGQIHEK